MTTLLLDVELEEEQICSHSARSSVEHPATIVATVVVVDVVDVVVVAAVVVAS